MINTNMPTNDRFDAALIVIWDFDKNGNVFIDLNNPFTKAYDEDTFVKDLRSILEQEKIRSQFSLDLMDKQALEAFLKDNKS